MRASNQGGAVVLFLFALFIHDVLARRYTYDINEERRLKDATEDICMFDG